MKQIAAIALLAGSAFAVVPARAAVVIYTDEASFQAALTNVTVEDFNNGDFLVGIDSDAGHRQGNHFEDRLTPGGNTTSFSFGGQVNGVGGYFNLSPGGSSESNPGIAFLLNGTTPLGVEVPRGNGNGFWGFVSDTSFSSVTLVTGSQGALDQLSLFSFGRGGRNDGPHFDPSETYKLDDLQFGALAGGVPEPATWAMMILGLGAVGAAMRRRRRMNVGYLMN